MNSSLHQVSIGWGNPYSEPSAESELLEGRSVWAVTCLPGYRDSDLLEFAPFFTPGSGWVIRINFVRTGPSRRWSPEAKAKTRLRNLRARVQRKAPLFVEELMAREIAARPGYFDPKVIGRETVNG
ncbi:MAG: hypothetical protein K9H25_23075 [Rhodospirillum sp.]|nr:hypothetical protein [Rhodospirillum sp.]MCF8491377.1 hypothetical protein [Rhodospirillum sp.]MCF8500201.1 hypothetical protein [Rhodospirillum sp.]